MNIKALLNKTYYFILCLWWIVPIYAVAALGNPINSNDFPTLITKITDIIIAVGIPIAAVFIVYAGFLFVSARGSEEQLNKAKVTLYWTIIGTVIVVGAKVIAIALQGTITNIGG